MLPFAPYRSNTVSNIRNDDYTVKSIIPAKVKNELVMYADGIC